MRGANIFFTGVAGTGKSVTLSHLVAQLRRKYARSKVALCASTGVAALAIGGQTLHSLAGCGVPKRVDDFRKW